MARPHPALIELAEGRTRLVAEDHGRLVESALEHRMHGLLWSAVQRGDLELEPAARTPLVESLLEVRAHHHRLWKSIASLVDRLDDAGIDVAVAKGTPIEAQWYDAAGERPCGDIDLLVAPHAQCRVGDLVGLLAPQHPLAQEIQSLVDNGALQSIELEVGGVFVDVHVDLFKLGVPSRQRESIWDRTRPMARPDGGSVRVPDAETTLVLLLVHLNKDRFRRLLGYVDVARVLDRSTLDWAAVETIVRSDGLDVAVWSSLAAVLEKLRRVEVAAPGSVQRPTGVRAALWSRLWRDDVRLLGDLGEVRYRYRQAVLPMLATGRAGEAARWWARRLVPDPALVAYRNPGRGRHYATRIIRGRFARLAARRRARARLETGGSPDPTRAPAASPGGG